MKLFSKEKRSRQNDFFESLKNDINEEYHQNQSTPHRLPQHALTVDEVLQDDKTINDSASNTYTNPLEALKKRMMNNSDTVSQTTTKVEKTTFEKVHRAPQKDNKTSLLERCKAYTVDDNGNDVSAEKHPLYHLETVAEILRSNSEKALNELSKKYDLTVEDLTINNGTDIDNKSAETAQQIEDTKIQQESQSAAPSTKKTASPTPTEAFERMVSDAESEREKEIFEEHFPGNAPEIVFSDELPNISDIDNDVLPKEEQPSLSDTATIKFTPIKDPSSDTNRISVSNIKRAIDIKSEFEDISSSSTLTELEQTEFEEFVPTEEFTPKSNAKNILRKLLKKRRSAFITTGVSLLSLFLLMLFYLPPLSEFIVSNPGLSMIVCGIIFLISVISNLKMFIQLGKLFTKKCTADALMALCTVSTIILTTFAVYNKADVLDMIFLTAFILFTRALSQFWDTSTILGNFKQIAINETKNAISLIEDPSVSFAMAKNAIDGDALIAAPQKTDFVCDFMKYSEYGTKLSGRCRMVTLGALLAALITGITAASYFGSVLYGFYFASAVFCLAAMPAYFFIDSLPLMVAASRLNRKGAMIAGTTAAQHIELSNAAVLSSSYIFPDGAITLHSMKVLADNNIDNTIMRAASLTDAVGSTLAPIFKRIAGTNVSYSLPDSDTVKYEERLGLSGWVDNELLFIGNRTLMEAHGIEVPSVEVDRKILRRGFFPVYLASGGKACALIVIQYNADMRIAKELRELTGIGVTLLIDNCDPNINEDMICDYFNLYEDSVKIMSNSGVHMYRTATAPAKECPAPAAFKKNPLTAISIINCASRIIKSNLLLTVSYALAAAFGIAFFAYSTFSGDGTMLDGKTVLLYEFAATIFSLLLFLIKKP